MTDLPDTDAIFDAAEASRRSNMRLGMWLFAVYTSLYAIFVLANAFAASVMETIVLAGLNLAIVYGFGLIVVAFVMAMLYGWLCKTEPSVTEPVATPGDRA